MNLSIVIPVYNVEKYLDECVSSVLSLRQDIQIVLIDDGSTDTSGEICDEWAKKDCRIEVIHQKNSGLSAARNAGICCSKGEYVMFLDSDDYLDKTETLRLMEYLDGQADVIVGLYSKFYESGNKVEPESKHPFNGCHGKMSRDEFLMCIPTNGQNSYLMAVRFVVNRKILLENKLFFFEGIYHEDEEWSSRLLCSIKTVWLTDCLFYNYRQSVEGSITSIVRPKHVIDVLKIMSIDNELRQKPTTNNICDEFLAQRMALLFLRVLVNINVLNPTERQDAVNALELYKKECIKRQVGIRGAITRLLVLSLGISRTGWVIHKIQIIRGLFR